MEDKNLSRNFALAFGKATNCKRVCSRCLIGNKFKNMLKILLIEMFDVTLQNLSACKMATESEEH